MAQFVQSIYNAGVSQLTRIKRVEDVCNTKDEDSQPVYTMMELAQECSRSPQDANAVAELLLKKVSSSSNPIVKYKALRAIKYIAEKSTSSYFKKACSGTASGPIREALKFSGPPDPILGNTLNVRVRESAQACLDEVFRQSAPGHGAPAPTNPDLQGRIQGYGSTTGNTIIKPTSNPSKYQGFGNPAFENGASSSAKSSASVPPASDYAVGLMSSPLPSEVSLPPVQPITSTSTISRAAATSLVGDESSLVAEMCAASGLRAQPRPEQLKLFVDKVALLDPDVVAVELTSFLDSSAAWQSTVRALCALEAVANAAALPGADPNVVALAGIFRSTPDSVQACAAHPQISVRPRAAKCLAALGVEGGGQPRASAAEAAAAVPDLLGGLDDAPEAPPAPADPLADLMGPAVDASAQPQLPAAGVQAPPASSTDVFGGMTFAGADAGGDMFSGMTMAPTNGKAAAAPPAAASASTPESTTDMFAGLSVNEPSAQAPAPDLLADLASTAAPAAPAPTPPAVDLFANMTDATPAPAQTTASDLFGDMTAPTPPASVAAAAPSSAATQPTTDARPMLDDLFSDMAPASAGASSATFGVQGMQGMPAAGYAQAPMPGYSMPQPGAPAPGMQGQYGMQQMPGAMGAPDPFGTPGVAQGMMPGMTQHVHGMPGMPGMPGQWMQSSPGMMGMAGHVPGHYGMQGMPQAVGQAMPGMQGQYGSTPMQGMQPMQGMHAMQAPAYGMAYQMPGAHIAHMQGAGQPAYQPAPPGAHAGASQNAPRPKLKDAFDFVNDSFSRK